MPQDHHWEDTINSKELIWELVKERRGQNEGHPYVTERKGRELVEQVLLALVPDHPKLKPSIQDFAVRMVLRRCEWAVEDTLKEKAEEARRLAQHDSVPENAPIPPSGDRPSPMRVESTVHSTVDGCLSTSASDPSTNPPPQQRGVMPPSPTYSPEDSPNPSPTAVRAALAPSHTDPVQRTTWSFSQGVHNSGWGAPHSLKEKQRSSLQLRSSDDRRRQVHTETERAIQQAETRREKWTAVENARNVMISIEKQHGTRRKRI